MSSGGSIEELLSLISLNTRRYQEYLQANSLSLPSHDVIRSESSDSEPSTLAKPLPNDIEEVLRAAIEASHELHQLLLGPVGRVLAAAVDVRKSETYRFELS